MLPFILVHIGDNFFPDYAPDAVKQILAWNPESDIYFICNPKYHARFRHIDSTQLHLIDINGIPATEEHATFTNSTHLDTNFRDGFWRFTTERLFILNDFMVARGLKEAIHIENDNTVYFSSTDPDFRHVWDSAPGLSAPRHGMQSLTFGILFIKDTDVLRQLCGMLAAGGNMNEMDLGYHFFAGSGGAAVTQFLKSCPTHDALRSKNCAEQVATPQDTLIFDAACYGQYLGGIDPRNGPSVPGFVNQDSYFAVNHPSLSYVWRRDSVGRRYPVIVSSSGSGSGGSAKEFKIANLHIHSKNLVPFLSRLRGDQGERFQIECDAWFGTDDDFRYNPNLAPYINGKRSCKQPSRVFVYAHRLGDFNPDAYDSQYVLVTGNSDENIDERYRTIFDHPKITAAHCQNLLIDHPKCHILPIAQANRQWPHGDVRAMELVIDAKIPRTKHIYNNFNIGTNYAARSQCAAAMRQKGLPTNSNKPYMAYLIDLASHKYSLAPPGNGVDTHRFWECIYLGVIPIVISNPLNDRLKREGWPMIVLNSWDELDPQRLIQE